MSLFIRTKLKNVFRAIELSSEEVDKKETLIETIISKGNRKKQLFKFEIPTQLD